MPNIIKAHRSLLWLMNMNLLLSTLLRHDRRTERIALKSYQPVDGHWLMNVIKEWIERKQKKLYNG